jgi:hypothetical protein
MFLLLWTFFIVFNWYAKAFNYGRTYLWHFIGLLVVYWLALLAILNNTTKETLVFVVVLFIGWGIMILVGFLIQHKKYPMWLVEPKGHNLHDLLRFSLSPNSFEALQTFRSREKGLSSKVSIDISGNSESPFSPKLNSHTRIFPDDSTAGNQFPVNSRAIGELKSEPEN